MRQSRFRQIARLEKLAEPYLKRRHQIEKRWRQTISGAANHAAILAFLIRCGDPKIEEPLSCAWKRFINTRTWKQCCNNGKESKHLGDEWEEYVDETPYDRDEVTIRGPYLRHALIAHFYGTTEREKLKRVFASAPPWLMWFAFGDYTAKLLGLTLPDLSSVAVFARSKADFDNWPGLPSGVFERRPWPDGPDNEPLARTDLVYYAPRRNLLLN